MDANHQLIGSWKRHFTPELIDRVHISVANQSSIAETADVLNYIVFLQDLIESRQ
jgi:hypothetical protein